ncbi:MAG: DUF2703 domain-containing protein [Methanomicrobiales archaeon]|nr:DUF2703 domain-containing protein [Methanomicrobiales archaeon]
MKHHLIVEWKHIGNDVTGTCDRCSLTGSAIRDVLEELLPYFRESNVTARFRETVLPDSRIEESNQILINGVPLEEYVAATVVQTPCCSCACITGHDETECRAIEIGDDRYEAIPAELLKHVIIGVVDAMTCGDGACSSGCGCGMNTERE